MNDFSNKKITSIATLGETLASHRATVGLTVEQAAKKLNLNPLYLQRLENSDYRGLPADIYSTNIIKNYAELLQLQPATVLQAYREERRLFEHSQNQAPRGELPWFKRLVNFFLNPHFIKYTFLLTIFSVALIYLGYEANKIATPPHLSVNSPAQDMLTAADTALLSGITDKEVSLSLNGRPLLTDAAGNFQVQLALQKGINTIKLIAERKHSRPREVNRQIIKID